jgi:hypothetical protein
MKLLAWLALLASACSSAGLAVDDEPCGERHRRAGGACVAVESLLVRAERMRDLEAAWKGPLSHVAACALPSAIDAAPAPDFAEGPCTLRRVVGAGGPTTSSFPPRDAGRIQVREIGSEAVTLEPSATYSCYRPLPSPPQLGDGTVLEIDGEGGAHYPAFAAQLPMPVNPVIDLDEIRPGMPIEVRWSGGDARDPIAIALHLYDERLAAVLECEVPDRGIYDIPASLTRQLTSLWSFATVSLTRSMRVHLEPIDSDRVIDLLATNSVFRELRVIR